MACQPLDCKTHQEIVGFKYPLRHFRTALKSQRKVKVVAIGSSSTAGADNGGAGRQRQSLKFVGVL